MTYADKLHASIARYNAAYAAANACPTTLEGTAEEAELHAAVESVGSGDYVASTAGGAMAALRLAKKEAEDFAGSDMSRALIDGAMAYLDPIGNGENSALERAIDMAVSFPSMEKVRGSEFLALFDALNGCIDLLGGIMERPQCGDHRAFYPAGKYLDQIQTFLMYELERAMGIAENFAGDEDASEKETRLRAALQFKISLAELSVEHLQDAVAWINERDEGRAAS